MSIIPKSRPKRQLTNRLLNISDLIPGERTLSRENIDRWKHSLLEGKIDPPTVSETLQGFYVTNGNHPVFAMKESGRTQIECGVVAVKRQQSVAAQDDVDCEDAFKAGLLRI